MTSNSSIQGVPFRHRLHEWSAQFMMRCRGLLSTPDFAWLQANIDEYRSHLGKYANKPLEQADILEIGFGARPIRMIALSSMGYSVRGVDIDQPILNGSPSEFVAVLRRNGYQRLLKSMVRHYLFDWQDRSALSRWLAGAGHKYRIDTERFIVGSVVAPELLAVLPRSSQDFIFAEDAFEHIPPEDLRTALARMHDWLRPDGIVFVRFTLFTGITGGHLVEWYPHLVDQDMPRTTAPWEHLRANRVVADTYLNKLRLHEYRSMISERFDTLAQGVSNPGLGRTRLSAEIRAELSQYSEEELLSNEVFFVLSPRHESAVTRVSKTQGAAN